MKQKIERRRFLRGVGACLALPVLDVSGAAKPAGKAALTETGSPLRLIFVYKPNGVNMAQWTTSGTGRDYALSPTLKPLAEFKEHFQLYAGFEQKNGWAGGDGAGDHARANATFLTGARPRKTAGSDIHLGISIDQVVAQQIGEQTRLASLELSCDGVRKSGVCDSGYSCAYQYNLSWRSATQPLTPEANPRLVFERLFGIGQGAERIENLERRRARQKSILDFVMEDAKGLHRELGRNDQVKLDEYLTGVREVERSIEKAERFGLPPDPGVPAPAGVPESYQDHLDLMFDMMVLAMQSDSTRVATFLQAHDGSNRNFPEIGVRQGHHALSHHRGEAENLRQLAAIDLYYTERFAYFLRRLEAVKERDGKSLLHNSIIVWGSGLSDPDRHRHDELPIVVAGHGGGKLKPGRRIELPGNTPMSNLYLRLAHEMGVAADSFGDSTGPVDLI